MPEVAAAQRRSDKMATLRGPTAAIRAYEIAGGYLLHSWRIDYHPHWYPVLLERWQQRVRSTCALPALATWQRQQFGGIGPCSFLDSRGQLVPKELARLETIIHGYEAQLAAGCQRIPGAPTAGALRTPGGQEPADHRGPQPPVGTTPTRFPSVRLSVHGRPCSSVTWDDRGQSLSADAREFRRMRLRMRLTGRVGSFDRWFMINDRRSDCCQAWRNARTASTRRLLSAESARPSFMKTVRTCDSTVLGEMTRRLQIAWFE